MKTQILLTLVLLATSSFFLFQNNNGQEEQKSAQILERNFFNNNKLQSSLGADNLYTYKINIDLGVLNIYAHNAQQALTGSSIQTLAHVYVDELEGKYNVLVAYSQYAQENFTSKEKDLEHEQQEEQNFNVHSTAFYKVVVEPYSGEILSVSIPEYAEEHELLQWTTQELVNDIFPDLRSDSFNEQAPIEEDGIGEIKPELKAEFNDQTVKVSKHYDSQNYVKLEKNDIVPPKVNYERDLLLDLTNGLVKKGASSYKYTIGEPDQKLQATLEDEDIDENLEEMMEIDVDINTQFEIVEEYQNAEEMLEKIVEYEDFVSGQYKQIQLAKNKKVFSEPIEEEQEEQEQEITEGKLGQFYAIYSKSQQLVDFTVLSQKVAATLDFVAYGSHSTLSSNVKVNGKTIKTLFNQSMNHCHNLNKNLYETSQSVTLFKVQWVLGGLITVPVTGKAGLKFSVDLTGVDGSSMCSYDITPSLKFTLTGDGRASLAGTISAGIYAKGTFLDSTLSMVGTIQKSNAATSLALKGTMKAAAFEFGGVYKLFTCDKSKLLSFELFSACKLGNDEFVPWVNKSTATQYKTFWAKTVYTGAQ